MCTTNKQIFSWSMLLMALSSYIQLCGSQGLPSGIERATMFDSIRLYYEDQRVLEPDERASVASRGTQHSGLVAAEDFELDQPAAESSAQPAGQELQQRSNSDDSRVSGNSRQVEVSSSKSEESVARLPREFSRLVNELGTGRGVQQVAASSQQPVAPYEADLPGVVPEREESSAAVLCHMFSRAVQLPGTRWEQPAATSSQQPISKATQQSVLSTVTSFTGQRKAYDDVLNDSQIFGRQVSMSEDDSRAPNSDLVFVVLSQQPQHQASVGGNVTGQQSRKTKPSAFYSIINPPAGGGSSNLNNNTQSMGLTSSMPLESSSLERNNVSPIKNRTTTKTPSKSWCCWHRNDTE